MKKAGRPPALSVAQQEDVRTRLAAGESASAIAREFRVGEATIRRLSANSARVREAAETLAHAQAVVAALPVPLQHQAVTLAEKLRAISDSMAAAAVSGADTAKTLHGIANTKARAAAEAIAAGKHDAATDELRAVAALTKIGNDAAAVPLGLISSNKDRALTPAPQVPQIDAAKLSPQALAELIAARDAAAALGS